MEEAELGQHCPSSRAERADLMPKEQSLQGRSPCPPSGPWRREVVENPCHLGPPAQPCLDSVLFQKPHSWGQNLAAFRAPGVVCPIMGALCAEQRAPEAPAEPCLLLSGHSTPEVTCRHLRRVSTQKT